MDIELLRYLFAYLPVSGKLIWKKSPTNFVRPGTLAGTDTVDGYQKVIVLGRIYKLHRIAWALFYGEQPPGVIDHIDGDRTNNRITNLRACSQWRNSQNAVMPVSNTSGYKGVSWNSGKYRAYINYKGKQINLGRYDTPEVAAEAYNKKARELYGEFARLNDL